jgi:hypothetical protein
MSNWNPNSKKHKAQHCGYKVKPTKQNVNSLLNLYSACSVIYEQGKELNKIKNNDFIPK